jgi:hypothetical protein
MQNTIFRQSKRCGFLLLASAATILQPGCGTLSNAQTGALLVNASALANLAGTAAATYYGGPAAGQAASTGLSALGTVLQGYVGSQVPASVVQTAPGVQGVGTAVLNVLAQNHKVTQADVNAINEAAAIEAAASAPATTGTSAH